MEERLDRTQEVAGSSPASSTPESPHRAGFCRHRATARLPLAGRRRIWVLQRRKPGIRRIQTNEEGASRDHRRNHHPDHLGASRHLSVPAGQRRRGALLAGVPAVFSGRRQAAASSTHRSSVSARASQRSTYAWVSARSRAMSAGQRVPACSSASAAGRISSRVIAATAAARSRMRRRRAI